MTLTSKIKILIDTQVFLWIFNRESRITKKAVWFVENTDANQFFLSDVSAWEASIKYGLGKLKLPEPPERFFPDRVRRAGYRHLPIDLTHVTSVHLLPQIHRDPFDRLLIAQARLENMTIISEDAVFGDYDVKTMRLRDIF